ncbi:MAG TPA: ROK family protein [Candidatus Didemnitutus sp.]|nr:ROK family protein [Candidatus Didemnitutus sp.]
MVIVPPDLRPPLEPDFLPAFLWERAYARLAAADPASRPVGLALQRPGGGVSRWEGRILGENHSQRELTLRFVERKLKFLLWQKGGSRVAIAGAPELAAALARIYAPGGIRAFDADFMGDRIYGQAFAIVACSWADLPPECNAGQPLGRHLKGCRIGFDLGGSDRKTAAVIDGQVVFSEEVAWDPYFQSDPAYHISGVNDSIARAAAHLPRVDAIGGSAAGVYVANEVRVASLFRGVPRDRFEREIRPMFFALRRQWGDVPFEVVNDGEVAALAGAMSLHENAVLGISMGTSMAGGYVTPTGEITSWLNELAFVPVDYQSAAPVDEWSGDAGCGVQYFSQQGVARFAKRAGFEFPTGTPPAEILASVQTAFRQGDARARSVFTTVGLCFGYTLALLADNYDVHHVLVLGRVTSGEGGALILSEANRVLEAEAPAVARRLQLHIPDEKNKRHGQAIAAASLPAPA